MGSRSKIGWNSRCTHRGPASGIAVSEALAVLANPKSYNRCDRRRARKLLLTQARHIERHEHPPYNPVQRDLLKLGRQLAA